MRALLLFSLTSLACLQAEPLLLPTPNQAIFQNDGPAFYQYVDRYDGGTHTTPWEGGQFGFVRSPIPLPTGGEIYSKFHEGIDIKPVNRDEKGEPLDEIKALAAGKVVYTSDRPGASNYGRYVIIEHQWDGCSYYSLYAHLAKVFAVTDQQIKAGETLGIMGYSGSGINKLRAHLHLELAFMLNANVPDPKDKPLITPAPSASPQELAKEEKAAAEEPEGPNLHGKFHGHNLIGIDVAKFYLAQKKNPALSFVNFQKAEPACFAVDTPKEPAPDFVARYPWLLTSPAQPSTASWKIYFTRWGAPIKIEPRSEQLAAAKAQLLVDPAQVPLWALTRGLLKKEGAEIKLSSRGVAYLDRITGKGMPPQERLATKSN